MLQLRCRCGSVRASMREASPQTTLRLVCYCKDCQAFARYVDPRAPALDAQGGTDIIQTSQALVHLTQGAEHLQAIRLTERGMIRIYAGCCNTPVGNLMDSRHMCLFGMCTAFVDGDPTPVVGPSRADINPGSALGEPKPEFELMSILRATGTSIRNLALWRMRGDHLESAFREDGRLIVEPRVLTTAERQAL